MIAQATGVLTRADTRFSPEEVQRFWSKVEAQENGCWTWTTYVKPNGYASIRASRVRLYAHRMAYELAYGPIPAGLVIDHMCHQPDECFDGDKCAHRKCVRPDHLKAVTPAMNASRSTHAFRTHCPRGHEYNSTNTYFRRDRYGRNCRACARVSDQRYRESLVAA